MIKKLGIIAGSGSLPSEISYIYQQYSGQKPIIAAIESEADLDLIRDFEYREFQVGAAGGIIEYLKSHNVADVVIIGGVRRPNLRSISLDIAGSKLVARILKEKLLGDDKVLSVMAKFLESQGLNLVSPLYLLKENNYDLYLKNSLKPSKQDEVDIKIGTDVLGALGNYDVGQAIIVEDGYILGIEAAEGTDNLIKRCAHLRKKTQGGVLIKMPKISQDMRLDIPTIGPNTILTLKECNFSGVAIAKHGVVIAKISDTIKLAQKDRIFISLV